MKISPGTERPFLRVFPGGYKVANIHKSQKKMILSDPVARFISFYPEASESRISALNELRLRYIEQQQLHKDAQDLSRKISRKIGAAKRSGDPVDAFKSEMQAQGIKLGKLATQLADTQNRILSHFEPADTPGETGSNNPPLPEKRAYTATPESCTEVAISLADTLPGDWNSYVEKNSAASIYHRAEWRTLIRQSFGHEGHYFIARDKNHTVVGILPLIHLKSRLFGDFLVSMPYFNYGGAIADHPSIELALMTAANEHAATLGTSHIEYRDNIPRDGWPVRDEKVNMILPLACSENELWEGFTPKLRAQIRRPQQENPQVLSGGKEYLDDFYSVFARNMRDLGTPVYGRNFFSNILETFPEACRIMVVRLGNRPVAAGFLIRHRDTLEIPWASTIREVNHLSMNMLLYWEVLKYALLEGNRYFDFGRSSRDSGTFRFKQQWGARPMQLHWHYWLKKNEELPSLNPDNPKFAMAINIWKKLPLMVTKRLGPLIVRNLP